MEKETFLLGRFEVRLDAKNRLPVPAKMRRLLDARCGDPNGEWTLYATAVEDVIRLMPAEVFHQMSSHYEPTRRSTQQEIDDTVDIFGDIWPIEPDGQNRILLPQILLEEVKFGQDLTMIGCKYHIDLHDRDRFLKRRARVLSTRQPLA